MKKKKEENEVWERKGRVEDGEKDDLKKRKDSKRSVKRTQQLTESESFSVYRLTEQRLTSN